MSVFTVSVKWQKQKFNDVQCDMGKPPIDFKAILFSLSGVPPERQKVMIQGTLLSDDAWNNIQMKNGMTIMMLGSAEKPPEPPTQNTRFIEDMDDVQMGQALEVPAGLTNLGNTCYMNATIQCLKTIPELKSAMQAISPLRDMSDSGQNLVFARGLSDVYKSMDIKKGSSVSPFVFLALLHSLSPQFAEHTEQGGLAQQDANEFWIEVIRRMQSSLAVNLDAFKTHVGLPLNESSPVLPISSERVNFVKQFMMGMFQCEQQLLLEDGSINVEATSSANLMETVNANSSSSEGVEPETAPHVSTPVTDKEMVDAERTTFSEEFVQLSCYILKDLKYLESGIRHGLETTLTKYSSKLGRDATYKKTMKISRLPCYLSIQLLRFSYKGNKELSVKILKEVKFGMELDMYEFCTQEMKKKLEPMREKLRIQDDTLAEQAKQIKIDRNKGKITSQNKIEPRYAQHWLSDDLGASNSGIYQLQAVLTHQGRSSRSGHYVAWIKKNEDTWFKCDDDDISVVNADAILKLAGGGDWHTAYVLLYGPKLLDLNILA
jgi:ubiquitin carboxyl-terminal hydrolase 14